jgi:transcriptional regulator with PAS, ATPase and Fis domain
MESADIVFTSDEMRSVVETCRALARISSPILIEGESGTGKELAARLIHRLSDRRGKFFVPVNCAAIPEALFESELFGYRAGAFTGAIRDKQGIFEVAEGGTLFLDEIGDLSPGMQAKLLRVLQENELRRVGDTKVSRVDFRLISATNRDLEREMNSSRFREDLFFRVGVLRIYIEPLRNRTDDIPALCDHFVAKHCRRLRKRAPQITKDIIRLFAEYTWPGNVRELENEIHRMVALADDGKPLTTAHVSRRIARWVAHRGGADLKGKLKSRLASHERQIIREALDLCGWNKTRAAEHLGLTRQGLHKKLKRLRITRYE